MPWSESWILSSLIVGETLAVLLLLRNIFRAMPFVLDSFTRVRGSVDIESSVGLSRDRTLTALLMLIPFVMLLSRFRIFNPAFLEGSGPEGHFGGTLACFLGYLLFRFIMQLWLRPRYKRSADIYTMARRFSYSAFIILVLLLLPLSGVLLLLGVDDGIIGQILLYTTLVVSVLYCYRKSQIFGLFCSPFTSFLYLCALEFLPAAVFVAAAIVK